MGLLLLISQFDVPFYRVWSLEQLLVYRLHFVHRVPILREEFLFEVGAISVHSSFVQFPGILRRER